MKSIKNIIRHFLYGRKWNQKIFRNLHRIALQGMNYGTDPKINESGELYLLNQLCKESKNNQWIIFDVGANTGDYTKTLLKIFGKSALVYSFEPSPSAFEKLYESVKNIGAMLYNFGFSSEKKRSSLYSNEKGGGLGSLYKRQLDHKSIKMNQVENVQLETLDNFCRVNGIKTINFLKLDTEGHELYALRGAQNMLKEKKIERIQFEFGGCNIDSRTFFQDFWYLLKNDYNLYRILKSGIYPIKKYDERDEIFTATNYLAVLKEFDK